MGYVHTFLYLHMYVCLLYFGMANASCLLVFFECARVELIFFSEVKFFPNVGGPNGRVGIFL